MSKITLNIVEPGSSTPVDPGITAVPNTGLFTHGIGGPEATIITVSIVVALVIVVAAVLYYRKKHNKKSKLTDAINVAKSKKQLSIPLVALAMVVSLGTLAALLVNAGKSNTNAAENELTVTESSEDLTIEVGDQPVFAVLPVELTVAEATDAGYTLTAFTDGTDIASTTDPANTIPMIAASEDPSALTDNTWGLSLSEPASQDDEAYATLSTSADSPTILKTIDDYTETPAEDKTTIYYGFYITPDIPYGTYEGSSITYSATPNYITTLSFNGNGNDGGEDMDSIIIPAGTTITLPQNTYTKDGYHFTGWNTSAEGTGDTYADEAEYTAISGESANATLYAQWEEDIFYMQDVATWGSSLSIGDEVVAVDNRDDKEYYVARLADGNIWMTQNLDLDIAAGKTYTSVDTDLANSSIGTTWTPTSSEATYPTGTTTWNNSTTAPESYDPGNLYWDGSLIYNRTTCEANGGTWQPWGSCDGANPTSSTGGNHYHLGNYYNWTAAVAMSDSSAYDTDGQDINQSICPAGWMLPKSGTTLTGSGSFQYLVNQAGLSAGTSGNIQNSPVYFVYGGGWNGSSYHVGTNGYYWSSIVESSSNSYHLQFHAGGTLYYQGYTNRIGSSSLRCVAR